ncbi:sensor histidine kinase [uncultured Cytophaga sp.]|uniref:sensor histidine kinase n=1 Tax=uncultured Cytophaga sp. TaxID=160238 RepID=UPI002617D0F9|nr:sensor histidine kinase [uncultured Cytophaga sp.]
MKQALLFDKKVIGAFLKRYFFSYVFFIASSSIVFSQNVFELRDSKLYYPINSEVIDVFEDTLNHFNTVESIQSKLFRKTDSYYFTSTHPSSTYWGRFLLTDNSSINNHWFFVSYNYSIDSLDIFVYEKSNALFHKKYRFDSPELTTREIRHKNFTIDFPIPKKDTLVVYIKLKNRHTSQYNFALVEHKDLFSFSIFEFYILGLFYGGLIMMAFYHLSSYFSVRDKAYLFYSIYIVIQGLYLSYRDSTALVNIFADAPWLIEYTINALFFALSVSILLYGRFFLELKRFKWYWISATVFIVPRIVFLIVYRSYPLGLMWFDLAAPLIVFVFSIISRVEKNKTATLFSISFFVILLGYTINLLWHSNIIVCTSQVFYSLYYAVIIQSLLLAIANAYRLNKLKADALHKQMLEEQVLEKTRMIKHQEDVIKEKTNDLDMLLYRASHDIKGPLKSIDGLCQIGVQDEKDKNVYFEHIQMVSKRLQHILNSLLHIAEQNRLELKFESINIYNLVQECIQQNLREYPDIKKIDFVISISENATLQSERFTLNSVVQNIIENAIKYMDKSKSENRLVISFQDTEDQHVFIFEDNGIGIREANLKNIFQMFYRANSVNPGGVGLGLYIVKQHIDRLNGQIEIASKEGEFTRFTIRLPR